MHPSGDAHRASPDPAPPAGVGRLAHDRRTSSARGVDLGEDASALRDRARLPRMERQSLDLLSARGGRTSMRGRSHAPALERLRRADRRRSAAEVRPAEHPSERRGLRAHRGAPLPGASTARLSNVLAAAPGGRLHRVEGARAPNAPHPSSAAVDRAIRAGGVTHGAIQWCGSPRPCMARRMNDQTGGTMLIATATQMRT